MMQKTITLEKNNVLKITGPASFVLEKGAVRIFGFKAKPPFKYVVPSYKSLPLVASEKSCLNIVLGEGASINVVENDTINVWENLVEKVLKLEKPLIIITIGTIDSGKSSLTLLIANTAVNMGYKTSIIDADIGQADIGPPTFITLGILNKQVVSLTEVKPATYSFIGTTTPYRVMDKVIAAILKLLAKAFNLNSQVIIINTDGWFKGRKAVEAKLQTIFHVKPHVVFIIKKENCINEVDVLFKYLNRFNVNAIVVESPKAIKERSISERRSIREYLYSKYFYGAKIVDLDLENLVIMNLDALKGKFFNCKEKELLKEILSLKPEMQILHATIVNNNLIVVVKGGTVIVDSNVLRNIKETYGQVRLKVLSENWEKGLVVSILNENLEEAGIGYIEKINFEKGIVRIRTNYEGEICGLIVGNIRLMYDEKTHTVREWGKWSL